MCCWADSTRRGEVGASGPAFGGGSMASGTHSTLRMEQLLQKSPLISHLGLADHKCVKGSPSFLFHLEPPDCPGRQGLEPTRGKP